MHLLPLVEYTLPLYIKRGFLDQQHRHHLRLVRNTASQRASNLLNRNLPLHQIPRGKVGALNTGLSEVKSLSRVRLFATPWTIAYQAPPSMRFSRQECWSGLPFPSPKYWSNRPQTLLFPPNKLQASQEPPGLVYKPVYTIASAIILWNIIK